ncbi:MAG: hypothetical protein Q9162_006203 [Coniocarpon cinnabarinum]
MSSPVQLSPPAQHLSLHRHDTTSNVFVLTLRKPPENRLNSSLCQEIIRALRHVQVTIGPDAPGALVTTTESQKFFCTGLDLHEPDTNPFANSDGFYPMLAALLDFPFPTVACLTGHTFGGACPFALAHDYRVMNSERGFFSMAIDLGLHFDGIGTLPRLKLQPRVARQMLLEAHKWTGKAAYADGIVDMIAAPSSMQEEALALAEKFAPKAKMGVYGVLRLELVGEAADKMRSISYVRSKTTGRQAKAKI